MDCRYTDNNVHKTVEREASVGMELTGVTEVSRRKAAAEVETTPVVDSVNRAV